MAAAGLYDPGFEHDACGVGFVADLSGRPGHGVVSRALNVLCHLEHRGAQGGDPGTGELLGVVDLTADLRTHHPHTLPLAELTALRAWTGFRPASPDNLPLIGAWPNARGLFIAAGHEGLGITTAPATAAIIAALITGAPPPIDASPYAPARAMPALEAA